MFTRTLIRQGEKIVALTEENKALYEENKELRYENEELASLKNKIQRIIQEADKNKENYFITFEKIKEELAVSETY